MCLQLRINLRTLRGLFHLRAQIPGQVLCFLDTERSGRRQKRILASRRSGRGRFRFGCGIGSLWCGGRHFREGKSYLHAAWVDDSVMLAGGLQGKHNYKVLLSLFIS